MHVEKLLTQRHFSRIAVLKEAPLVVFIPQNVCSQLEMIMIASIQWEIKNELASFLLFCC